MIVNPAIIALIAGALLSAGFGVYASVMGVQIVRFWDLTSGSHQQLQMERRTYLISTILAWLLGFEIFSLFLFIFTADHLHPMFVGAMCAAGSLNVNGYGYPALIVKIISVLGCGIWLVVNQADNQAEDYPLIRFKYKLLFWITGLLVTGAFLQIAYFKGLKAQVITSCCGTLFSSEAKNLAGNIAGIPVNGTRMAFFATAVLHARAAIHLLVTGRGGRALGWCSGLYFIVALVSIISFISVYYYELPTHHCPFDILQSHYHFIGYPLYAALFGLAVTGMATGVLNRFLQLPSLTATLPILLRRCSRTSLICGLVFLIIAIYPMIFSDFKLTM